MPSDSSPSCGIEDRSLLSAPNIDGCVPSAVITPDSPQAIADVLADAADRSLAVAPIGGCTALGLGNVPDRLDLAISTALLGGVLDYEPMDLALSVGAGARFGDVQAILAEHGQTIPLEAPRDADATIGGLIATALAGPRRLGSGTLRDLLIGISVAHPSGTVTKAGGMVVKNVTGFDLTRLYLGSLGTLGVIVSANFKVLPLPRTEATVLASMPNLEAALAAAATVRATSIQPVALEIAYRDKEWLVAVRIEGRESTVSATGDSVAMLLGATAVHLERRQSGTWWRTYVDDQSPAIAHPREIVVRLGVRPRSTPDAIRASQTILDRAGMTATSIASTPGLGSVLVRLDSPDDVTGPRLLALQTDLLSIADTVTILAAEPTAKRGVDVWGRMPDTIDVMRALKTQFDSENVLNPGRFAGRI